MKRQRKERARKSKRRTPTLPEFYYDGPRGFWIPNGRGGWVLVSESSLRRELKILHFSPHENGECISPLERAISQIQKQNDVSYAGPLAGWQAGLHEILGRRVLVTESPRPIRGKRGDWSTLRGILEKMFGDEQLPFLFGWLKIAVNGLAHGRRPPGQALVIVGERESGKSLLQWIITKLLGGREARPFRYIRGGSEFNSELFGAEHQVIEDEAASHHLAARRWLAQKLKELTANSAQSCHPKGRQAVTLAPFWRVSISLNCERASLSVLPLLEESIADKLIILKTRFHPMPMSTESDQQRDAFGQKLMSELPAFVHFLMKWEIPVKLRSPRFGILHFHHPEIVAALNALPAEMQLLALIDRILFSTADSPTWLGTSTELQNVLVQEPSTRLEAQGLFDFPGACGFLLSKLVETSDGRVNRHRSADARRWRILPP